MQPPFRPRDLLATDRFISFCADRGVQTSREQLEFYDRHNLIVPAVRVSRGYVLFRKVLIPHEGKPQWRLVFANDLTKFSPLKVDPKTYYDFGSISCGSSDWLAQYEERGVVSYPAREKYRPWGEDLMVRRSELPTSRKELGEGHFDFYARYQCFPLKEAQSSMVVEVRDETLFVDDESWLKIGRNLRRGIEGSLGYLQEAVLKHHRLMTLMSAIRDVLVDVYAEAGITFEAKLEVDPRDEENVDGLPQAEFRRKAEREAREDAGRDARDVIRLYEQESAPAEMRKVIAECGYSIEDVRRARQRAAHLASESDPTYRWTEFTERIPANLLRQARGDYALALEHYRIVNELGWVLRMLGDKPPTLKKLLVGSDAFGHCLVCGEPFQRKKRPWVTCGSPTCKHEHNKDLKRRLRSTRRLS